ncbi:GNAT family N-acetyltransferase [Virgibacillus flavescens]|uniref:GNAT family N-acetyltransferase n=1 Tax=Virgibacillus flavescens TaxID=1611422 RepID=UPI003D34177C
MIGENIHVRSFTIDDAAAMLSLQTTNKVFFEKFSMEREDDYYTIESQVERVKKSQEAASDDKEYNFGIFRNDDNDLLGTINLFHVMRGSLQSAFIGYFMDQKQNGKGYTTEAVKLLVEHGFEKLNLHRIEAGVMPHNIGSIRVLEKSGFHKEGIAKKNVQINGKWEDHQVLAIINPAG